MPSEDAAPRLDVPLWAWLLLGGIILSCLAIDLVAHRGDRGQGRKAAIAWSTAWIGVALAFGGWVFIQFGRPTAEDYLAAFLVEKSLSVDNLFVFLMVFSRLRIPESEQRRVLAWGILGAFVTRGLFIASGSALLTAWHGVVYVLGALLIYTGVRTARKNESPGEEGRLLPFMRRHLPFTPNLHGHRFTVLENGRRVATPLLLALAVIEVTDVLFAIDSIPAVFAITAEPFIVYSSNIFAMLGLRALYLVLAALLTNLKYMRYGLAGILVFAGAKMLASGVIHVPPLVSLFAIVAILLTAVLTSLAARRPPDNS